MIDPDAPASPLPEGTVVAGKYRLGEALSSGGMGTIVRGVHVELDQAVAIKFLATMLADSALVRERFLREARAAARLRSDHVVRVFDVGTHEGAPYMAMELLEGNDLADELDARGRLPVSEAVDLVREALDAVAEAHQRGIVHRDLKPSNLFLVSRGDGRRRVKVLDFGISKLVSDGEDAAITGTGLMLGSPGYMSPEQVRSTKDVDARTDVWSMGVILWEVLAGSAAFRGESLGDVFAKIREEPLESIRVRRPDVPEELDRVIRRCLERNRELRWPDALALREALVPFASKKSLRAPAPEGPRARASLPDAPTVAASSGPEDAASAPTVSLEAQHPVDVRSDMRQETASVWTGQEERRPRVRVWAGVGLALLTLGVVVVVAKSVTVAEPEPQRSASAAPVTPRASGAAEPKVEPTTVALPITTGSATAPGDAGRGAGKGAAERTSAPKKPTPAAPPSAGPVKKPTPSDDLGI